MVYQPDKPAAGDVLSQSQGDIQQNFLTANSVEAVNHYPFDDVSGNAGKHKYTSLVAQGSDAVTSTTDIALYSKTVGSFIEEFLRRQTTGTVIQLSTQHGDPLATTATSAPPLGFSALAGQTYLPGGFIIKWGWVGVGSGTASGTASFSGAYVGATAFPNNCFGVWPVAIRINTSAAVPTINLSVPPSSTGFSWVSSVSTSQQFLYLAIGN